MEVRPQAIPVGQLQQQLQRPPLQHFQSDPNISSQFQFNINAMGGVYQNQGVQAPAMNAKERKIADQRALGVQHQPQMVQRGYILPNNQRLPPGTVYMDRAIAIQMNHPYREQQQRMMTQQQAQQQNIGGHQNQLQFMQQQIQHHPQAGPSSHMSQNFLQSNQQLQHQYIQQQMNSSIQFQNPQLRLTPTQHFPTQMIPSVQMQAQVQQRQQTPSMTIPVQAPPSMPQPNGPSPHQNRQPTPSLVVVDPSPQRRVSTPIPSNSQFPTEPLNMPTSQSMPVTGSTPVALIEARSQTDPLNSNDIAAGPIHNLARTTSSQVIDQTKVKGTFTSGPFQAEIKYSVPDRIVDERPKRPMTYQLEVIMNWLQSIIDRVKPEEAKMGNVNVAKDLIAGTDEVQKKFDEDLAEYLTNAGYTKALQGLKEDVERSRLASPAETKVTVGSSSDLGSAEDGSVTLVGSEDSKGSSPSMTQQTDQGDRKDEASSRHLGGLFRLFELNTKRPMITHFLATLSSKYGNPILNDTAPHPPLSASSAIIQPLSATPARNVGNEASNVVAAKLRQADAIRLNQDAAIRMQHRHGSSGLPGQNKTAQRDLSPYDNSQILSLEMGGHHPGSGAPFLAQTIVNHPNLQLHHPQPHNIHASRLTSGNVGVNGMKRSASMTPNEEVNKRMKFAGNRPTPEEHQKQALETSNRATAQLQANRGFPGMTQVSQQNSNIGLFDQRQIEIPNMALLQNSSLMEAKQNYSQSQVEYARLHMQQSISPVDNRPPALALDLDGMSGVSGQPSGLVPSPVSTKSMSAVKGTGPWNDTMAGDGNLPDTPTGAGRKKAGGKKPGKAPGKRKKKPSIDGSLTPNDFSPAGSLDTPSKIPEEPSEPSSARSQGVSLPSTNQSQSATLDLSFNHPNPNDFPWDESTFNSTTEDDIKNLLDSLSGSGSSSQMGAQDQQQDLKVDQTDQDFSAIFNNIQNGQTAIEHAAGSQDFGIGLELGNNHQAEEFHFDWAADMTGMGGGDDHSWSDMFGTGPNN